MRRNLKSTPSTRLIGGSTAGRGSKLRPQFTPREVTMSIPTKYARKIRELRAYHWPDINFKKQLWHRKRNDGFTTIPRTLPLIIGIIDDLSKGTPAGMTYAE